MRLGTKFELTYLGALLALIAFFAYRGIIDVSAQIQSGQLTPTRSALLAVYQDTNDNFFGSRLPKDTKIQLTDLPGDMATVEETDAGQFLIRIDRRKNPILKQAEMSLIHEMCHIDTWEDPTSHKHGEGFQVCMRRLAQQGAFNNLW